MINKTLSELNFVEGEVLLFDKPFKWTSFDLVRKVRARIKRHLDKSKIKVGHAGTLDPRATGLMIICTGKKTKEIQDYQASDKEYVAEITLGSTTPSFDLETQIDKKFPIDHIDKDFINSVLMGFMGEQEQTPPVYSAKWVDGQRAYTKARKGIDVAMKSHIVTFYELELLQCELPVIKVRIKCSKGTYIRSFANDLGIALKSGAHLSALRRTKIGEFSVEDALKIDDFNLTEPEMQIV